MLLLSFSIYVTEFNSSRLFLCYQRLIFAVTVKSFSETFLISPNQIKFFTCFLQFFISFVICATCTDCMFFCSISAVILVDASFMSSFAGACSCFCFSSVFPSSLNLWRSKSFYFSVVSSSFLFPTFQDNFRNFRTTGTPAIYNKK